MDFNLSKMQKLLVESAEEFLKKEAVNLARDMEKTELGYSVELWKKMAELGWMGILLPEDYGGVGVKTDLNNQCLQGLSPRLVSDERGLSPKCNSIA